MTELETLIEEFKRGCWTEDEFKKIVSELDTPKPTCSVCGDLLSAGYCESEH